MTTVLIATRPDEARCLLPWAMLTAGIKETELVVVLPQRATGETRLVEVAPDSSDGGSELVTAARRWFEGRTAANIGTPELPPDDREAARFRLFQLLGEDWTQHLARRLTEFKPSLIIIPAPTMSKDPGGTDHWQSVLLDHTDCEVMLLRDDGVSFEDHVRLAVILGNNKDNELALKTAAQYASATGAGAAMAVYIEPDVGDFAAAVGIHQLNSLLNRSLSPRERERFSRRAIVAPNTSVAVSQLNASDFDMLLIGTSSHRVMRQFLSAQPAGSEDGPMPAFAVVRRAETLGNRLWNRMDRWLRSIVPQLAREERVALVSRIQSSSQWDFDFILLISLATLIACLGLAENSGAVIVGAMLVAPLMTPIAGIGLGVAHGNAFLTRIALRTVLRGFATAIGIGLLFGFCVQLATLPGWLDPMNMSAAASADEARFFPTQMENRTRPQFYDLLIALASGIAAAYALGRPNLFSALPGVAVAAALVPPVATSGIAYAHGEFLKGSGALLLFVTNMVIIILGTSLVFQTVGIRAQKEGRFAAKWPRNTLVLLVILSIVVTILIEFFRRST